MRMYTCSFKAVAITAVQDLFEILAGTNVPVAIFSLSLFQTTDLGDAAEEVLRLQVRSGQTTSGSGGSAGTEVAKDVGDAAATAAVLLNNTTQASAGTIVEHWQMGWNIRVPLREVFQPEERPFVQGGRRLTVELIGAPADSLTVSGTICWGEGAP